MPDPVKPRRRYDSPRRREQAAATRRDILDAAQRLFERHGYPATSMAAIAAEAGVALKTVYTAFETKRGVLLALWHLLLRGDEDAVPVGERAWFRQVLEEASPERQLRLNARNSRAVKERAAGLLEVLRTAAPTDRSSRISGTAFRRSSTPISVRLSRRSSRRTHFDQGSTPPRRPTSCGR